MSVVLTSSPHRAWSRFNFQLSFAHPPALFVPGRWGVGWTLNFGRPAAVALMVVLLCLGIGVPFLIVRMLTR